MHVLPLRVFLCRHCWLYSHSVNLQHRFLYMINLLLNVIQAIVVGMAAIFCPVSNHSLLGKSTLDAIDLAVDVRTENLHFAGFGSHTHVGARLSAWIRLALVAIIGVFSTVHLARLLSYSGLELTKFYYCNNQEIEQ